MIECRCPDAGVLLRFVAMEQNPHGGPGQPVPPGTQSPQQPPQPQQEWQPPYAPQPSPKQPGPEAYVVKAGTRQRITGLVVAIVCGGLGGGAIYSLWIGAVNGGTGRAVIGGIIGGLLLLIGICGLLASVFLRNYLFIIDNVGIRIQGTRLTDWQVEWDEVAAMALVTAQRLVRDSEHGNRWRRRDLVWLELIPVDIDAFKANHPLLDGYDTDRSGYRAFRLSYGFLGGYTNEETDAKLRAIAPEHYHGIIDRGVVRGMRPI